MRILKNDEITATSLERAKQICAERPRYKFAYLPVRVDGHSLIWLEHYEEKSTPVMVYKKGSYQHSYLFGSYVKFKRTSNVYRIRVMRRALDITKNAPWHNAGLEKEHFYGK